MTTTPELEIVQFADAEGWSRWLSVHPDAPGVWLKFAKRFSPTPTVTYREALDEALCYGWIDGQVRRFDEHFYLQRFTPRRPRSRWSQINRQRASELIDEGRMKPAGLAQVQAALADGRWERAYEPQAKATVPDDFRRALDSEPEAAAFFATLTGSRRYAFLHRLHHVQSETARQARIADYIERLKRRQTLD